jgi:hypothetical protein
LIDENEVSAMMWELSAVAGLGRGPLDAALASARMTIPPYARGYVTHEWEMLPAPNQCEHGLVTATEFPAPMFADFLDALRCGGVSADVIDGVTEPATYYPYPSATPLCQ